MKLSGTVLIFLFLVLPGGWGGPLPSDSIIIASVVSTSEEHKSAGKNERHTGILGCFLKFYHTFISSQDGETCTFSRSCSSFGAWAVRERGVLEGAVLTADRLTRCNGIKPGRYSIDPVTNKNIDDFPDLLK